MIDPERADSPFFRAPDGRVYVDRDGPAADTASRWRRLHDPAGVRRQDRLATASVLAVFAIGYMAGGAFGFVVAPPLLPGDEPVVARLIGVVLGGGVVAVPAMLFAFFRSAAPDRRVIPVPDEVLQHAPPAASTSDIWRWSVAVIDEAAERRTIGYETNVERPTDVARADRATARYGEVYRAYLTAAAELGLRPREPAINLPPASSD